MNILTHVIRKRLAFGGPVFSGPAKFLWENEIVEQDYCFATAYTRLQPTMKKIVDCGVARDRRGSVG